jgi:hypothetical protein
MKPFRRQNYIENPSGTRAGSMVQCGMEEGRSGAEEAEQARRILQEETPRRIERLRRDLRNLYLDERGRGSGKSEHEQAA